MRVVTARLGARSLGLPSASKPSRTWALPISGAYFSAGASRSSLPSSTSCRTAVPVIALVVEKIANTESVVMSASWPRTRLPAAPS